MEDTLHKSESMMHAIAESAQDAILVMDAAGCISFWNPAAEHIFGYASEEAIGENLHRFLSPERFWEAHTAAFEIFRKTGQGAAIHKTLELSARRKNGEEFPIELSLSAIQFDQSWHALGIIRDITARKEAEEKLRRSENLYRTFITACTDMVFLKDAQFHNIVVNELLAAFFGRSVEDILGKTDFDLMPESAAQRCRQSDLDALASSSLIISEEAIGDQTFETLKFPVNLGSEGTGVGGYIRNVTERKKAVEALRQSEATLRSVFRATPIGLCIMKDRVFQDVNKTWLDMLGYSETETIGRTTRFLYESDEEYERLGRKLYGDMLTAGLASVQTTHRRKDGELRDVILTAVPLQSENGYLGMEVVTVDDITERKRLEERLQRAEKIGGPGNPGRRRCPRSQQRTGHHRRLFGTAD